MWKKLSRKKESVRKRLWRSLPVPLEERTIHRYPSFSMLVGVILIAESVTYGNQEITLVSLEKYADGFLLHARYEAKGGVPLRTPSRGCLRLDFRVSDDCGRQYETWPTYLGRNVQAQRLIVFFMPALDPDARKLRVGVPDISWSEHESYQSLHPNDMEQRPFLWTFEILLSGLKLRESRSHSDTTPGHHQASS